MRVIEVPNRLLPVYDDMNCLVCFHLFSHSFFFLILYEISIVLCWLLFFHSSGVYFRW